jgi:mRNA interferase MazF
VPITFHPRAGQILHCDFSQGFKDPEMVKRERPVVVLTPYIQGRHQLVTVVALSTVPPSPVLPFHCQIPKNSMPQLGRFQEYGTWVKGDMVYSVGWHRLDLIRLGKRDPQTGKRLYFKNRLGSEQMKTIRGCVLHGLNLGPLTEYL